MIDPTTMLILYAILLGSLAVFVAVVIIIIMRISKSIGGEYYASLLVRSIAFLIDVTILRLLSELVWAVLDSTYYSMILLSLYYFPIGIITTLYYLGAGAISYFIPFLPALSILAPIGPSLLAMLLGFFYFFAFDAFLRGRTIGRYILRMETSHEREDRSLTYREAYYNAVGKSFILVDIILGQFALMRDSSGKHRKQVRFTQKLARAVTRDSNFKEDSKEGEEQSFAEKLETEAREKW